MNIFIPKLVQRYQVPLLSEAFQNSPRWSTRMGTEKTVLVKQEYLQKINIYVIRNVANQEDQFLKVQSLRNRNIMQ